jgi:hypothetical protein
MSGQGRKLAEMYQSLDVAPAEFSKLSGEGPQFLTLAPTIAIALRETGHGDEADALLANAEGLAVNFRRSLDPMYSALLARIYAAQNRKDQALSALTSAVADNWYPPLPYFPTDLALDPAFALLKGDPRFERIRQQILGTIKREHAKVRIADLN